MRRGASLSTSHFQYTMSNFCMCFLQQYQHPPCLTQAICLDSICSLDNASNEYVALLFYNISLACPHLRKATVCAVSNVDGIRQQAWETEMEPQTVWHLWFGGHVKWMDCHPWHFPGKKKHGVSAKLMVGEVRVFGWTLHTQKYVNGHMNFPDCCCIVRFVSLIWGTLWNDAKNRFALGLCRCLACKHPTLGKDTLCHALAMEHNPKDIFQHIFRWQHIFRVICVALCNWCSRCNCQMPTLQKRYCLLFCKYYSTCQNS